MERGQVGALRRLWDEGHATAEIGRRLRVSKNAVVGKAHRLDLEARPDPIRRSGRTKQRPDPSLPPGRESARDETAGGGVRRDMRAGASEGNETRRSKSRSGAAACAAETTMGAVPAAQNWDRFVLLADRRARHANLSVLR